jgi:hypothetical protein
MKGILLKIKVIKVEGVEETGGKRYGERARKRSFVVESLVATFI